MLHHVVTCTMLLHALCTHVAGTDKCDFNSLKLNTTFTYYTYFLESFKYSNSNLKVTNCSGYKDCQHFTTKGPAHNALHGYGRTVQLNGTCNPSSKVATSVANPPSEWASQQRTSPSGMQASGGGEKWRKG